MSFLTLGGVDLKVRTENASEAEPTLLGESARAFDGSYRSGIRGAKRSWTFTLQSMLAADFATLQTLIGLEATLVATGAFINGDTINVVARLNATPYVADGIDVRRSVTLTILEK